MHVGEGRDGGSACVEWTRVSPWSVSVGVEAATLTPPAREGLIGLLGEALAAHIVWRCPLSQGMN